MTDMIATPAVVNVTFAEIALSVLAGSLLVEDACAAGAFRSEVRQIFDTVYVPEYGQRVLCGSIE